MAVVADGGADPATAADHADRTLAKLGGIGDGRPMTRSSQGIEPPSDPERFTHVIQNDRTRVFLSIRLFCQCYESQGEV